MLLENLFGMSCSGSWVVLGFSVGMEAFDELLSLNVPWSQVFYDVLRICGKAPSAGQPQMLP